MPLDFDRLVRYLHAEDPRQAVYEGWSVLRVGRNRVWRIRSPDRTLFAKIMDDARYYEREHYGLELSRRMARGHDWMVAPELVYRDPAQHALVTTALPGTSVAELLRSAFRIDRNPLRRSGPVERFTTALSHVLRWLNTLHGLPARDTDVLFDHTGANTRDRVLTKLRRAIDHGRLSVPPQVLAEFSRLDVPDPDSTPHLICGDATLGNFFWDGGRVGRIDFEDLGFGSPARDVSELRQGFESIGRNPWYWSVRSAAAMLPHAEGGDIADALYRLEWAVDRHWAEGASPGRRRARLEGSIQALLGGLSASGGPGSAS